MIKLITMTGADNSISPQDLLPLSEKFPRVEWGILLSNSKLGGLRFPNFEWLNELEAIQSSLDDEHKLNLSGHICQQWCRDIFQAKKMTFAGAFPKLWNMFQRIQLNFSPYEVGIDFVELLKNFPEKQFIFQVGKKNRDALFAHAVKEKVNVACLFDRSGGKGIVPASWPKVREDVMCGYAGGLGPDTITQELENISQVVGDKDIWIDMEGRIRTPATATNFEKFDLAKVEAVLEQVP